MAIEQSPSQRDRPPVLHALDLHRRVALEVRTVTVSLSTALRDLAGQDGISLARRVELRKRWCQRARVLLQDVRDRSAQPAGPVREAEALEIRAEIERLLDAADVEIEELASIS